MSEFLRILLTIAGPKLKEMARLAECRRGKVLTLPKDQYRVES